MDLIETQRLAMTDRAEACGTTLASDAFVFSDAPEIDHALAAAIETLLDLSDE